MEYTLKAHMPGLVARVVVEVGEHVEEGQELAVINCMKTEMSCKTEKAVWSNRFSWQNGRNGSRFPHDHPDADA